ncbi:hypothetical protein M501DRAFT_1002662 [Patellaria atrata CBS 101060]|uniref:Transmembrane protein n=1 Tax=Patellaria atrata CBS 101060 TaxID=1346257 RepID=A0A9P4SD08_9PEZI|nr:hypothetical protein M501DRAFT_1002662 [Patellaria atrata CBS 101060]
MGDANSFSLDFKQKTCSISISCDLPPHITVVLSLTFLRYINLLVIFAPAVLVTCMKRGKSEKRDGMKEDGATQRVRVGKNL